MNTEADLPNKAFVGTETQTEDVQDALLNRPKFSIRTRIILSFGVCFILICASTTVALSYLYHIREKQRFLEKIGSYMLDIQDTRRHEKNFFLYNTDLYNTFESLHKGQNTLKKIRAEMKSDRERKSLDNMEKNLEHYEEVLDKLAAAKNQSVEERSALESQLRKYGSKINSDATARIEQEQEKIDALERSSITTSLLLLGSSLLAMIYIALFLTRQILVRIGKIVQYTERISSGDFSPIKPARKYRDEFSVLAIAINRMLHEIKHQQAENVECSKMAAVGTLTAGIAHELNNPLNNIGITTEAMMEAFDDYSPEEKRKMLEDICTQVERAGTVVRNLLDFTRVKKFSMLPIAITDVINSTVKLANNEITINSIDLELNFAENLPQIKGNLQSLQQVFVNMVLNSIQAMPEKGKLTIDISNVKNEKMIRVDISDTGTGISPEDISNIFQPFFTTKDVGEGTGLGLSVSYGIIEQHGGRIEVKSEPGYGTTFSVFLPHNNGMDARPF